MRTGAALLVAAAGLLSLGSGVAPGATRPPLVQVKATGTVTALDLSHVAVGKVSCLLRGRAIDAEAQEFAVGEHVTVDCLRGLLKTITLAPTTGPSHSDTYLYIPAASSAAANGASTGAGSAANSAGNGEQIAVTWSFAVFGPQPTVTGSFSVTGTVAALGQNSIQVDVHTCPLDSGTATLLSAKLELGETVTLSCTLYSNGGSSGSLSSHPG